MNNLLPVILACLKDIASDSTISTDARMIAHYLFMHLNVYYMEVKLDAHQKARHR